jgi:hypothetical protein
MKMRRYETASWILLILSVVNFALVAPVAAQDIHEVPVDVLGVTGGGAGASEKRMDPRDEGVNEHGGRGKCHRPLGESDMEIWFQKSPSFASPGSINRVEQRAADPRGNHQGSKHRSRTMEARQNQIRGSSGFRLIIRRPRS